MFQLHNRMFLLAKLYSSPPSHVIFPAQFSLTTRRMCNHQVNAAGNPSCFKHDLTQWLRPSASTLAKDDVITLPVVMSLALASVE